MDEEIKNRLDAQDRYLQEIFTSVEKTRKYFLIMMWGTVLMFVLPLIGLIFVIPSFLSMYTTGLDGLL